jgi:hypothetical protein
VFWGSNRGGAGGKEARDDQQTSDGVDGVSELAFGVVDLALAAAVLIVAALAFSTLLAKLARQGPVVVKPDRRRGGLEPVAPAPAVAGASAGHDARLRMPRRVGRASVAR